MRLVRKNHTFSDSLHCRSGYRSFPSGLRRWPLLFPHTILFWPCLLPILIAVKEAIFQIHTYDETWFHCAEHAKEGGIYIAFFLSHLFRLPVYDRFCFCRSRLPPMPAELPASLFFLCFLRLPSVYH